jgi:hypothetical protein
MRRMAASEEALARARRLELAFATAWALGGEAFLGALGADPLRSAPPKFWFLCPLYPHVYLTIR